VPARGSSSPRHTRWHWQAKGEGLGPWGAPSAGCAVYCRGMEIRWVGGREGGAGCQRKDLRTCFATEIFTALRCEMIDHKK
jgi:hypothetical protein